MFIYSIVFIYLTLRVSFPGYGCSNRKSNLLFSWCFEPSKPQGITSGLQQKQRYETSYKCIWFFSVSYGKAEESYYGGHRLVRMSRGPISVTDHLDLFLFCQTVLNLCSILCVLSPDTTCSLFTVLLILLSSITQ